MIVTRQYLAGAYKYGYAIIEHVEYFMRFDYDTAQWVAVCRSAK